MRNLKFIFLLLWALLVMGCAEQGTPEIIKNNDNSNETRIVDVAGRADEYREEISNVSAAEPNGVLTLGQVLALTLMNNPELKVFSLETRAAEARELQAGLWPNPEIGVEFENVGGTGAMSGFGAAETTIQLSQLIELGNKSQKRKKVASFSKELAGLDYQSKRLEIFSEAAKGFVQLLQAQEKLAMSNELLELSEKSFEIVEKRVDAGKDSRVEKTRASVALANIKMLHNEIQLNLEYSRRQLAFFWGQDKPIFEQASGNLNSITELPTLENLTNQLRRNPEYTRWQTEIRRSQAVLDLEKSKGKGDITFGAGVKRFNEGSDNAFVFGFSIPLPVSDRNQGAKQEAIYNLAKSRQEEKAAWLKLQSEFNQTYQKVTNSYNEATSVKNEVLPGAIEMFDAATRAYQEGKVDYLNVLDAQRTLFDIKNKHIESLADYHMARNDIERFIGGPIQPINISESEK